MIDGYKKVRNKETGETDINPAIEGCICVGRVKECPSPGILGSVFLRFKVFRVKVFLLISSQSKVETYLHFFDSKFNNWFGIFAPYNIQAVETQEKAPKSVE